MFEVWHQFGDRWYRLVDKVGKNYVSNRYDGGDVRRCYGFFGLHLGRCT